MKPIEDKNVFMQLLRAEAKIATTRGVNRQIDHVLNTAASGAFDAYEDWSVRCRVVVDGIHQLAPTRGEARKWLMKIAEVAERWSKTNLDVMEEACAPKT